MVDEFVDVVVVGEEEGVPELSEFEEDFAEWGVVFLGQMEAPLAVREAFLTRTGNVSISGGLHPLIAHKTQSQHCLGLLLKQQVVELH